MTEKDFERIGQLMDSKLEPINAKLNQIDARLDGMDARFQQIDARFETFKSEIISEFDHLLKIQSEEFFHEFKAATEGYAAVTEEINAYCAEMGVELPKIDGEEVIRQIRLNSARRRVEQELKRRREEEQKP